MKLSKRMIALLILVAGLASCFLLNKQAKTIEAETQKTIAKNTQDAQTEAQLRELFENMDTYREETQKLFDDAEEILLEFPTFLYLEDKILLTHDLQDKFFNKYNASLAYGESEFVMNTSYGTESTPLELYAVTYAGEYSDIDYTDLKELVNYGLGESELRFVTNSFDASFSVKTGMLSGKFSMETFFIDGQSTPYEFSQEALEYLGDTTREGNLMGSFFKPE